LFSVDYFLATNNVK